MLSLELLPEGLGFGPLVHHFVVELLVHSLLGILGLSALIV